MGRLRSLLIPGVDERLLVKSGGDDPGLGLVDAN
jgi:hypothetical protein